MTFNSDSQFYRNDSASPAPSNNNPELNSQISYDGRRASSPNTGSRYLAQVNLDDSSATRPTMSDSSRPCEWINTKFNANKNGSYEVTIRDGNIYIKNEDGQERLTTPQVYHPANQDEGGRRDANYYNDQSAEGRYRPYPPQRDQYYSSEQPYPYQYPQQQNYGYERPHVNVGSLILGGVLGALIGGHRHGGYYGGGGGYDYGRYESAPVGYVSSGFSPINYRYNQQQNYNYGPQNYSYGGDNSYYSSNQNDYMPPPRYSYRPQNYAYNSNSYQNPQYTSGDYPGDNFYSS